MSRRTLKKSKGPFAKVKFRRVRLHQVILQAFILTITALALRIIFSLLNQSEIDTRRFNLIQPQYEAKHHRRKSEIDFVRKRNSETFQHVAFPASRNISDLLRYCKRELINIIANADILFDDTILQARNIQDDQVYAITRHEMDGSHFNRPDSQDVWIFKGFLKENLPKHLFLGKPGIDNRLAFEFDRLGYQVSNPSKSISAWHVHRSNTREYTVADLVSPPYAIVYPIYLQEIASNSSTKLERFPDGFTREQVERMALNNK